MHTTNYKNTFIEPPDDCPVQVAAPPPLKEPKSAARLEYEMLANSPYRHTSDDVIYEARGKSKGISREDFFSKGQPCFRASPLVKRYGWGVHSDDDGKIAIYAKGSEDFDRIAAEQGVRHIKALRLSSVPGI